MLRLSCLAFICSVVLVPAQPARADSWADPTPSAYAQAVHDDPFAQCEGHLAEARARRGRALAIVGAGDALRCLGASALSLLPATHRLELRARGYLPLAFPVTLAEDSSAVPRVVPAPVPVVLLAASPERASVEGTLALGAEHSRRRLYKQPWLWTGIGLFVASAALGLGLGLKRRTVTDAAVVDAPFATAKGP